MDAAQVKTLTARNDGRENLIALGRRENETHIRWRLFQGLQKRIPRRVRQHMTFVNDEDFVLGSGRLILHRVHYRLNILHLVVGGRIKLNDIQRPPFGNFHAIRALAAGFRLLRAGAVQGFCENARERRLTNAARTYEKIGVRHTIRRDGVAQGTDDMLLPHDIIKCHRTVLQRQRNMLRLFHETDFFL